MSNEISKSLLCVQMRSGVEIWLEEDTAANLQRALQAITTSKFVMTPDGRQTINTADIVGVFLASTMEEHTRRKNGEWKCHFGEWHVRRQECDCKSAKYTEATCGVCFVEPCVCSPIPAWQDPTYTDKGAEGLTPVNWKKRFKGSLKKEVCEEESQNSPTPED